MSNTPMLTLQEHNEQAMKRYMQRTLTRRRGEPLSIACDRCGSELVNPRPHQRLMSLPPKVHANCPACGAIGYAIGTWKD